MADNTTTQHQHMMYNPVTPDVSPPPSSMTFATPRQPKNDLSSDQSNELHLSQLTSSWKPKFNIDTTAIGDTIDTVTSTDIQEMENVRNHLQNMLKTCKGFNIDNGYEETSYTATEDDGKGDAANTSVDTAAFLQKLLPNSSPMEELRAHFPDQSRGNASTTQPDQTSHLPTRQTNDSIRATSQPQSSDRSSSAANKSLMSENGLLREQLEREKFRRKHCEQQIQELHSQLLEVQQNLAVAVSSERKKDVMIEQLDKTLAKVVEGWKRHENEKLIVINTLKQEREVQEQAHQKQQEMLLQFEKELERAVEAFTKEQDRAAEAEKEKQEVIEKQAKEREHLLEVLAKEKEKVKTIDEEKLGVVKEKEQAQHKYVEAHKQVEELSEKTQKMGSELKRVKEEFNDSLTSEKRKLEEERKQAKESKDGLSSIQKDLQRLEIELDTTHREKESLKMEMSLMQARHEASKAKEETERQADLERQMTKRLEELHQHMAHSESGMRESHRKQIQEINNKHKEEMHQQLEKFHEEIKKKDSKHKTSSTEYEERLTEAQDKIATLSNLKQQLENQRQNLTIRMHQMMQAHCDEALRLLGSNRLSPPGKTTDTKVDSLPKVSPRTLSITSRWQHQVSPPSSTFTNPANPHLTKDASSFKPFAPAYSSSATPVMNYQVHYSAASTRPSYTTQASDFTKSREAISMSRNQESLINKNTKPTQYCEQQHTNSGYNGTKVSIAVPAVPGYTSMDHGYQESSMFGSYIGDAQGDQDLTVRSGVDFVPLKSVHDDLDTQSVISALQGSPESGPLDETTGHPEIDYQLKVTPSGGSNGTLLEQDLEESHVPTMPSPAKHQITSQGDSISEQLQEQEQRQAELNHYVNMLLKRSPGHPYEEVLEQLPEGLMTIPSSAVQAKPQSHLFPTKAKTDVNPGYPSYTHHNSVISSNSVTKDVSQQSHHQAFSKSTLPAPFAIHEHEGSQFQHSTHPQTPPRRDKDPVDGESGENQPSLTPKQMKQLSKLLSLMAEGQPGVQVPSAQQLFGVLKEMQKGKTVDPRATVGQEIPHGVGRTKPANISHVKRNLDTSFPPRKQKHPGPSVTGDSISEHHTRTDQYKTRPASNNSAAPPRSVPSQGVPRHQAATKASVKHTVQPKVEKRPIPPPTGKQTKALSAWR